MPGLENELWTKILALKEIDGEDQCRKRDHQTQKPWCRRLLDLLKDSKGTSHGQSQVNERERVG